MCVHAYVHRKQTSSLTLDPAAFFSVEPLCFFTSLLALFFFASLPLCPGSTCTEIGDGTVHIVGVRGVFEGKRTYTHLETRLALQYPVLRTGRRGGWEGPASVLSVDWCIRWSQIVHSGLCDYMEIRIGKV